MSKYLLGIDIGGGSVKCLAYAIEEHTGTIAAKSMSSKALFTIGEFGYGMDTAAIFAVVKDCISDCLKKGSVNPADIKSLAFSTLRHTLVAIDKDGKVLFSSPNRDARAVDQTMRLIDTCADEIYTISGHRPMPNLMACKLQWLRDTQPDLYSNIETAFTLSDYLNFKLTGIIKAERSNAGETMLYDLALKKWSDSL
ncbi:MAG: FGGY family carbohydrate kinase, partial [Eubacteriales bacterium]